MTLPVVATYVAVTAAALGAAMALWLSGMWRVARTLLVFVVASALWDMATLMWPDIFWTPVMSIRREAANAVLGLVYALELAVRLPHRVRLIALRGLTAIVTLTGIYIVFGWPDHARAAYRAVGLADVGAAGALVMILLAGVLYDMEFSALTRRALSLLAVCYVSQAAAIAPFETWLPLAHQAQLLAAWVNILTLLVITRTAWAAVHA